MNVQKEFEMFHYHASCAINHVVRMVLALAGKGLELALRGVNFVHDSFKEPINPEVNYETHVQ